MRSVRPGGRPLLDKGRLRSSAAVVVPLGVFVGAIVSAVDALAAAETRESSQSQQSDPAPVETAIATGAVLHGSGGVISR